MNATAPLDTQFDGRLAPILLFSHMQKVGGTRFGHNVMDLIVPPREQVNHCHIRSLFEGRENVNWMLSIWFSGLIKEIHSMVKYSAEDCYFVWDHADWSLKKALDVGFPLRPEVRYVALVRSPLTIGVSDHFYRHRQSYDYAKKEWPAQVTDKILEATSSKRNYGKLKKWLSGCSNQKIKCGSIGMPKLIDAALCDHSHHVCRSESAQLKTAEAAIDTAFMIGLTEAMDSAICLLYKLLYAPIDTGKACSDLFQDTTDRTNETPPYKHLLTPQIQAAIRESVHPDDTALYDRAKAKFITQCHDFNVPIPDTLLVDSSP